MTTTAEKPAKLPREQDPRNPVHRLTALLDEGTLELITPDDDSGMLAAVGSVDGTINTCGSSDELVGTGFEVAEPGSAPCQADPKDQVGGGTGWLTTVGNVKGGEIITLRIAVWDTSDGAFDSVALIDNFQWSLDPSDPGTVIDVD